MEMKILTNTLLAEGCYDQLNLPSLAFMEMIPRRISQVVEAYHYVALRRLVGHLSFCGLLDQSAMSCLSSIYACVPKHHHESRPAVDGRRARGETHVITVALLGSHMDETVVADVRTPQRPGVGRVGPVATQGRPVSRPHSGETPVPSPRRWSLLRTGWLIPASQRSHDTIFESSAFNLLS